MDLLRGVIERITYHNEETGYTVAKLIPERREQSGFGQSREVPIVGSMLGINVGESVELQGRWTIHAEYGRQFVVDQMRTVLPATVAGIEKYLGSGLIRGVGPVTAKRIVKYFGVETLSVIEEQSERLHEVPGVGRKRTELIIAAWQEQKAIKEVMLFLQSHGVSTSLATKIYKFYGDDAIVTVRQDPYRLARDIYGIGFLTADRIAQALGLATNSPERVAAGVAFALNQATEEGHVYLPISELVNEATQLLDVSREEIGLGVVRLWHEQQVKVAAHPGDVELAPTLAPPIEDAIPQLLTSRGHVYAAATTAEAQQVLADEHAVYLTPFYYSEQGVAGGLHRLLRNGESAFWRFQQQRQDWEGLFQNAAELTGLRLAPQQYQAIQAALTHRLTILTGGPGTGKTTTMRTLLRICEQERFTVILAAPTGRAAKRLAETTGREAKTLHRLLEFKPAEGMAFQRNADNPLEGDLLIVDEASMLDQLLTNHLFKALPPGMHLLLVGDVDQLPSVGAGNVLKDMIAAIEESNVATANAQLPRLILEPSPLQQATVIRLHTIFRQAAGSYIITNAHQINQGIVPTIDNEASTDFFLFRTEEPERAAQLCVELVKSRIPKRFGIPSHEIQVLSPMHRGIIGVGALNEALQAGLNPPMAQTPEKRIGNRIYRLGDRVMQIRNNYDKEVYNGDMGQIQALDMEMQRVTVNIDGRLILYDFLELDELVHAFAVSVHKSQGSEFPAVVIPILTSHYMMLQRNLLYTAVTRAKRLVVIVGQPKALAMAVNNDKVTQRFTGLRERLTGQFGSPIIDL